MRYAMFNISIELVIISLEGLVADDAEFRNVS